MADWIYDNDIDLTSYEGFVYRITNLINNREYLGKKALWRVVKKQLKASSWKCYYGSSEDLKNDIKLYGKENFKREILSFHKTKTQLTYAEDEQLFKHDVLREKLPNGDFKYYNKNISGRFWRGKV